jgi:inosine/xanthosine triphosphatase
MRVHVGTRNPLKGKAVRAAFAAAFPNSSLEVIAVPVDTGLPPQPFEEQVVQGAKARAQKALQDADFGVGIEAGLVKIPGHENHFSVQFCAIVDAEGRMTVGHGPGFQLPHEVEAQLLNGSTLNREMSRIAGIPEIKSKMGAIGVLSHGLIDRLAITREAVWMALIPRLSDHH